MMSWSSFTLGKLQLSTPLVLSPMSGVTCSAFRRLMRELNGSHLGLVITEFVSVEALTRNIPRALETLKYRREERPLGMQIFGYDIERMCKGALMAEELGAELVEVNCGCPAPKVVRKGGGCELMRQPEHLAALLRRLRAAVKVPLTVKMRSGYDAHSVNAEEIARICQEEGADAVIVHGRTRAQLYRGVADWEIVKRIAEKLSIPVFGSGDVIDDLSAAEKAGGSRVQGLYIGRGALVNPFVFEQIVTGKKRALRTDPALVLHILYRYAQLLAEDFPPKVSVGRLKQLVSGLCKGHAFRRELLLAMDFSLQQSIISREQEVLAGAATKGSVYA